MNEVCAICQTPIAGDEPHSECPGCRAEYHADCWTENGGCAVYGCDRVPPTEGRAAIEIPVAYWGQEHKPCPACNVEILAAAVRCRHCGAVFQTARPLGAAEFNRATSHEAGAPRLRTAVLWLFALCVVPFTAPAAAIFSWFWTATKRDEIEKLPALYGALTKIGIGVGFLQTLVIVVLALLFTLLKGAE